MINPSASGWIDKFFALYATRGQFIAEDPKEFYASVRNSGFIYGYVTAFNQVPPREMKGWTAEELTKAALLTILYDYYRLTTTDTNITAFIDKAIHFYTQMTPESFSLLKKVLPAAPRSHQLENILNERVHTNDNIISRNFSHILTNALLFMDVLAFKQYLIKGEIPDKYLHKLEETVLSLVSMALKFKTDHSEYDSLLIKLFEASVRYTKFSKNDVLDINLIPLEYFTSEIEKYYLLDMAAMAMWNNGLTENNSMAFIYSLADKLCIDDEVATESIASFEVFIKINKKDIPYFKYSNPVKHFYDNATQTVALLINRNRRRLTKELMNNGELMLLLTHSTHRSLNDKEKKKMKKQLLEICRTIPSLTIFLVPGGSLLLPLLIKFIPQLLPAMFNENLDRD